jgi:hypothetical protein
MYGSDKISIIQIDSLCKYFDETAHNISETYVILDEYEAII